jgi:hypothetical protein
VNGERFGNNLPVMQTWHGESKGEAEWRRIQNEWKNAGKPMFFIPYFAPSRYGGVEQDFSVWDGADPNSAPLPLLDHRRDRVGLGRRRLRQRDCRSPYTAIRWVRRWCGSSDSVGRARRRKRSLASVARQACITLALFPVTRVLCLDEFDALPLLSGAGEDGVYLQTQEHH